MRKYRHKILFSLSILLLVSLIVSFQNFALITNTSNGAVPSAFVVMRDRLSPAVYAWNLKISDAPPGNLFGNILAGSQLKQLHLTPTERIVAVYDIDGDGHQDVVTQETKLNNDNWSDIFLWKNPGRADLPWAPRQRLGHTDGRLHAVGVGPIGKNLYIIFRNHAPGPGFAQIHYQQVTANAMIGGFQQHLASVPDIQWRIAGVADINHDKVFDLIFHNRLDGRVALWRLNQTSLVETGITLPSADPKYFHLVGPHPMSNGNTALIFRDLKNTDLKAWIVSPNFSFVHGVAPGLPRPFQFVTDVGEVDYKHYLREYPLPNITIPKGQLYSDRIPATFDLAERAGLALSAMLNALPPEDDYNMFWYSRLIGNRPFMITGSYPQMNPKFLEAMALMRIITGRSDRLDVDRDMLTDFARNITPQGLQVMPARERSPDTHFAAYVNADVSHGFSILTHVRYLSVLSNYQKLSGHPVLPNQITGDVLLAGLESISSKRSSGNESYYEYYPHQSLPILGVNRGVTGLPATIPWPSTPADWDAINIPSQVGDSARTIHGPADYGYTTGNPKAQSLARNYSKWIYKYYSRLFKKDGGFHAMGELERKQGQPAPHSAIRTKALNAMLTYATANKDQEALDFVNSSYLWLRNHPSSNRTLGYFPEFVYAGHDEHSHAETDEIADMIDMAVKMAHHDPGNFENYWWDAEHYLRNHFAEMQLTDDKVATIKYRQAQHKHSGWYDNYSIAQSGGSCLAKSVDPKDKNTFHCKVDDVADQHLGAWGSYSKPHDWGYSQYAQNGEKFSNYGVMNCCLASAARTLHVAWDKMLELTPKKIKLHLLMNRATKEVVVHSYMPYHGRIDIFIAAGQPSRTLEVRVPEWISPLNTSDISIHVNGKQKPSNRVGNYLHIDAAGNSVVTILFPFQNKNTFVLHPKVDINGVSYKIWERGYNVIRIVPHNPQPTLVPMYNQYSPLFDSSGNFINPVIGHHDLPERLKKNIHRYYKD